QPVIALMPEKLVVYYTNDYIYYKAEGWMGFFSSAQIINTKDSTRTLIAKFLDKKYANIQSLSDKPLKFENSDHLLISDNINLLKFKGFDAVECDIKLSGEYNCEKKVIYTNQFNIDNPNIGTPFHCINGILLNYTISTMGVPVMIEFINSKDTTVSNLMFAISDDYQIVDREKFEAVFEEYLPK
ncbi:MAG TPA: hypothetical protein PKW37_04750, partial [Salinivirgaceae bacterium]|nr:hypothetical protein [Salinivirgaceae bacterium]